MLILQMDDAQAFVLCKIYWKMAHAIEQVRESSPWQVRERQVIVMLAEKRWKQMHTSLHGAAFSLHPQYQIHTQCQNLEVINKFKDVYKKLLPRDQDECAYQQ